MVGPSGFEAQSGELACSAFFACLPVDFAPLQSFFGLGDEGDFSARGAGAWTSPPNCRSNESKNPSGFVPSGAVEALGI